MSGLSYLIFRFSKKKPGLKKLARLCVPQWECLLISLGDAQLRWVSHVNHSHDIQNCDVHKIISWGMVTCSAHIHERCWHVQDISIVDSDMLRRYPQGMVTCSVHIHRRWWHVQHISTRVGDMFRTYPRGMVTYSEHIHRRWWHAQDISTNGPPALTALLRTVPRIHRHAQNGPPHSPTCS